MPTAYLLFSERNALACQAALEGIGRAYPHILVEEVAGVDEILLHSPSAAGSLRVLIEPTMEELELALTAGQEDGLAHGPVVALASTLHSSALTVIPEEDWHAPLLAQVFHAAVQRHELLRENARLRGDLMTFARRISHDLRTPLSGIFTTAELLKEILADHSEEDAALTTPLYDSTQLVLKLIERTSQVARATVEPQPIEMADVGQVAWAGRQTVERAAMKMGVRMQEPKIWPLVACVPAWLQVVWANLLQQSVQRSPQGGTVEMQWKELPDSYEFSVQDQGPELKEEQRQALWWPFEKLHQGHSAKSLDLPIARRLVELQGGRCGSEVVQGGGLRFFFTLPKGSPVPGPVA